jgi:quinol monooxygenase YgiN
MYGLISKIDTVTGQRDALAGILVEAASDMPGCLSYVVANDAENPNALWITEVWDSPGSHEASLSLPSVQAAMLEGRPLITGFSQRIETAPIGGHGLS